jgi:hypothetical protein
MKKITIVYGETDGESWEGIYKDSKLVYQNHSLNISDIIRAMEAEEYIQYEQANDKWFSKNCQFPKDFKDVKLKKRK